ncbi:MAG: hypothetical protein KBD05_03170 [Candidatus Pacebacteria bacterium]|nr:hypothetical protein [Candidatus Paceibacterota bacterium]
MRPDQTEQINSVISAASRERDKFDNIIFLLTAGTLSLSAAFVSSSTQYFLRTEFLFLSWAALVLGLISILLAYTFVILHFRWCAKGIKTDSFATPEDMEKNGWYYSAETTNWLSVFFLVVGIIFLTLFGYFNINIEDVTSLPTSSIATSTAP